MHKTTTPETADTYIRIGIKQSLINRAYSVKESSPSVTIGQILNNVIDIGLKQLEGGSK
jgi:hypothetical protein